MGRPRPLIRTTVVPPASCLALTERCNAPVRDDVIREAGRGWERTGCRSIMTAVSPLSKRPNPVFSPA